jgi:hypothetical protein
VLKFINFRFCLFTPPLGDFQLAYQALTYHSAIALLVGPDLPNQYHQISTLLKHDFCVLCVTCEAHIVIPIPLDKTYLTRAKTDARNKHMCRRFDPGGSLDRRVKLLLRVPAQMGWREMEHKGGRTWLVLSCARGMRLQ